MRLGFLGFVAAAVVWGATSTSALAGFMYDEGVDGDLSNDRLAPTLLSASSGLNTIMGKTSRDRFGVVDLDYVTVVVPTGFQFSSLVETDYSGDGTSFIGVQSGTVFTEIPTSPDTSVMLGWLHIGDPYIGTDILPALGAQAGTIGFTPPLPSGEYTFWIQETSTVSANYTFTFKISPLAAVVPEPSSLSLACAGVVGLMAYMRRRRA